MRVLVAMSGGVDSSVAAALLRDAGHEVVGATLKLWGGASDAGCCSVADVEDARRVAQVLGVDHHVFAYTEEFAERVVEPYVRAHAQGLTPNPCIDCNRFIKFDLLVDRARRLGFDALATGHHARVVTRHDRPALARGRDAAKDQSYVLGYLTAPTLAYLQLPVGAFTKDEVRAHAARLGLRTWDKPDSQDVCFIGAAQGRRGFLAERIARTPAVVVDQDSGAPLGHLEAAELVTVGQRRQIPSPDDARRYVTSVDLVAGRVAVTTRERARQDRLDLDPASVTSSAGELRGGPVWVQTSAHGRPVTGQLRLADDWCVDLDAPVPPVAPGQSAVFFDRDDPDVVAGAAVVRRR